MLAFKAVDVILISSAEDEALALEKAMADIDIDQSIKMPMISGAGQQQTEVVEAQDGKT